MQRWTTILAVCGLLLAVNYRTAPAAAAPPPRMLFGDATRHGRPFAKDPCVIKLGGRYLLYYSMAPSADKAAPQGWAVGIAESRDLIAWTKVGEILPEQECERNGLVNGKALLLDGKVHLFYNSYGNGKLDALCHAVSDDGLQFRRDPTNPILRATGDWNSGRAIDCDAFEHDGKLWLLFATRDPEMKTQMLVAATAPRNSDFGRAAWTQLGDGPVLRPELPWETKCIEAPSVIKRGDTLVLFYGGGYNNDPQQVGCATSTDGLHWTRLFREPLLPNGQPGDWNASETGHPGVFQDDDGHTYLFIQGNGDRGKTWFLSCVELGWRAGRPWVMWDSPKFPTPRPGPSAHHENVLLGSAQSLAGEPSSPDQDAILTGGNFEVESVLDIAYYEGADADPRKHKLDLFLPKGQQDFPVLFFVHGGAWISGDRKLYSSVGRVFARNGIGTVVISYRLTPTVQHPGHIEDVARAFAWTHQNIGRYGGRADRIFVTGQSAGGHLAALLATNPRYLEAQSLKLDSIRGAMPISGIYTFAPGRLERVIGAGQEAADSASPLKHVSGQKPPFLILYAQHDFPGCGHMSLDLCAALQKHDVTATCTEIKDRNHITIMFFLMLSEADPTTQALLKFVAAHSELKLTPRAAQVPAASREP